MRSRWSNISNLSLSLLLLLATGCSLKSKPPEGLTALEAEISEETFTSVKQIGTPKIWDNLIATTAQDSKHRIAILDHGREALELRLNLIRSAKKSIKIATYIWKDDEVSRLLLWEVIRAAKQRGVEVQLITDQWGTWSTAKGAAAVAVVDPNIKFRIYNPTANMTAPGVTKTLGAGLTNLDRINTRLHAKMIIVDERIALIGGRNIANAYYDFEIGMNYLDRDIVFVGPEVNSAVESFNEIWNSNWVIKAQHLKDVAPIIARSGPIPEWTRTDFELYHLFGQTEKNASDPTYIQNTFIDKMLTVENAKWVCDHPLKAEDRKNRAKQDSETTAKLVEIIDQAEHSLVMQSPYFVILKTGQKWLKQRHKDKPELKIHLSTNSLAAADHANVYGALFRYKRAFVQDMGIELWEMKPIPQNIHQWMAYDSLLDRKPTPDELAKWSPPPFKIDKGLNSYPVLQSDGKVLSSNQRLNQHTKTPAWLCIHAKSIIADDEISYIGSFNLDPRSADLNVENGLVIYDIKFALTLRKSIERTMTPKSAYLQALRPEPGRHEPLTRLSEWLFIDLWPTRAVTSFDMKDGAKQVPLGHEDFYKSWRAVGDFPLVRTDSGRKSTASNSKAFGIFVYPLY